MATDKNATTTPGEQLPEHLQPTVVGMSPKVDELVTAIIKVMKGCQKGVDKNLTVGSGSNSYKGVGDKDVKMLANKEMVEAGLCIIPMGIDAKNKVTERDMGNNYIKTTVFTEVDTHYRLLHKSGQWIDLVGYGHGSDSLDKAAGKATTYALKYTLLYTFLIPTGSIDDTDAQHSDQGQQQRGGQQQQQQSQQQQDNTKVSMFKTKYPTEAALNEVLAKATNVKDIANLYFINAELVESSPDLKAKFTDTKNNFLNPATSSPATPPQDPTQQDIKQVEALVGACKTAKALTTLFNKDKKYEHPWLKKLFTDRKEAIQKEQQKGEGDPPGS